MRASRPAVPRPPPPSFNPATFEYPYGVYSHAQPYHLGHGMFSHSSDYVLQDEMIDDFAVNQGQYLMEEVVDSTATASNVPALPAPEAFVPPATLAPAAAQKGSVKRAKTSASVTVDEDAFTVAYRQQETRQKELEMQIRKTKELESMLVEQQSKLSSMSDAVSRNKAANAAGSASQDCTDADDSGFVSTRKRKATPVKLTIKRKKSDEEFYVEQEDEFEEILPLAQSSGIDIEENADDSPDIEELQSSEEYLTMKVRKRALNKPELSFLKDKLEEDAASLTDQQVLAADPKSLTAPDKRRRTLLLQKARQAKYISKTIEERGSE